MLTVLAIIHHHDDPLGPIRMPLSSLASDTPTLAGPSVSYEPLRTSSSCVTENRSGGNYRITCRGICQAYEERRSAPMCSLVSRESPSGAYHFFSLLEHD